VVESCLLQVSMQLRRSAIESFEADFAKDNMFAVAGRVRRRVDIVECTLQQTAAILFQPND
jgi:hypothetical protein